MSVDDDDVDGPLDPRIQMELENLNNATDDINQLEIELDEARRFFEELQSNLKNQLIEEQNNAGSTNIMKAKVYFEAVAACEEAQLKCRLEAESFRKASENLAAAMETETVAMQSFKLNQHKFNEPWQEWLNQVTAQVMEDSNKRIACEKEHQKITAHYKEAEKRVKQLGEKYRKALMKTKLYFEIKERIEQELPLQKEKIRCLEKSIQKAKCIYATSLRALEEISNQIHQQRRDYDIIANGPREPGVGAELVTPEDNTQVDEESSKFDISRRNSKESCSELDKNEAEQDMKEILELRQNIDNLGSRSADGSESTSSQWELELQAGIEKVINPPLSSIEPSVDTFESDFTKNNFMEKNVLPLTNVQSSTKSESQEKSFFNSIYNVQSQNWHSLTNSPINSIISKSKLALRNSFSKSLVSSPVNKGAPSFVETKVEEKNDCENVDQLSNKSKPEKQKLQNSLRSHSLDSTPVHRDNCATLNSIRDYNINTEDFKNSNQITELPLLSIFNNSKALDSSKEKSLSMVNLDEKKGLKKLLGKTVMNNIQAVSVERLANVRCKLITDG